jgi:hypothetical protein
MWAWRTCLFPLGVVHALAAFVRSVAVRIRVVVSVVGAKLAFFGSCGHLRAKGDDVVLGRSDDGRFALSVTLITPVATLALAVLGLARCGRCVGLVLGSGGAGLVDGGRGRG